MDGGFFLVSGWGIRPSGGRWNGCYSLAGPQNVTRIKLPITGLGSCRSQADAR